MSATIAPAPPAVAPKTRPSTPSTSAGPRVWFPAVMVVAFWAFYVLMTMSDFPISTKFLSRVAVLAGVTLMYLVWWLSNRRVSLADRFVCLATAVAGGVGAALVCQQTWGTIGVVFSGLPLLWTAWTLWLIAARKLSPSTRRNGLIVAQCATWGFITLVRMDSLDGDLNGEFSWRWTARPEDNYLAERAQRTLPARSADADASSSLVARPGDWPAFRGPNRDGVLHGTQIATDWAKSPPKLVWRQRIGPAWSSVVIVGDRLFTQEQRGEAEVVVCLDAGTGHEIWAHEDPTRFSDGTAGPRARATPTFVNGRLYTSGATGLLNCLDAATGKLHWSRNIAADTGVEPPMWGLSASPLVVGDVVVAYTAAGGDKGLVAYHTSSGEPAWSHATGRGSYSSPQLVALDGESQVAFFSDEGVLGLDAATGAECWSHEAANPGIWRAIQPQVIGQRQVLIGSEDLGLVAVELAAEGATWKATEKWKSRAMKPAYNDLVLLDGQLYGFDGSIFCCVDAETGKRRWKGGRYGHGQSLLLADQKLLVVQAETGEVVLLAATPDKHEELGRFQAIEGKTWNHPVIAHGRLYVRNDEAIACYDLSDRKP